ncbi:MAG: prepilin-type N-terminal cleavage/methylation domain-containing protein [Pyrinomonadaceae bacterium]
MNNFGSTTERGFSLIELFIVLVILAVLTTLAIANFRSSKVDFERQAITREFKVYLERARFDSVKRRAVAAGDQANIVLTGPSSFTAQIDFDENRVLSAAERRVVDFTQRASTQIEVSDAGLNYPITIRFDQRGHATAKDNGGAIINPIVFTICSSTDCSSTSSDRTVLALSSSGTVAVLRNGTTPSAAPTPVISNTSPTINCYVLIANSNTTCSL